MFETIAVKGSKPKNDAAVIVVCSAVVMKSSAASISMSPFPSTRVAAAIRVGASGCPVEKLNGAAHAVETEKISAAATTRHVE